MEHWSGSIKGTFVRNASKGERWKTKLIDIVVKYVLTCGLSQNMFSVKFLPIPKLGSSLTQSNSENKYCPTENNIFCQIRVLQIYLNKSDIRLVLETGQGSYGSLLDYNSRAISPSQHSWDLSSPVVSCWPPVFKKPNTTQSKTSKQIKS